MARTSSMLLALGATFAAASPLVDSRALCGETAAKVCFGPDGGTPQNITVDDAAYIASYLRYIGTSNPGKDAYWTMPPEIGCSEWTIPIPSGTSVLALAKHINPRVNSSVLYQDLATTIDGGENASDEEKNKALLGCTTNGGMMGVIADPADPAYNTPDYKNSKAKPSGIIVKLVRDPAFEG